MAKNSLKDDLRVKIKTVVVLNPKFKESKHVEKQKDGKSSFTFAFVEEMAKIKNNLLKSEQETLHILENLFGSTIDSFNVAEDIEQLLKSIKEALQTIILIDSKVPFQVKLEKIKVEVEDLQSGIEKEAYIEDDNDLLESLKIEIKDELKPKSPQKTRRTKSKSKSEAYGSRTKSKSKSEAYGSRYYSSKKSSNEETTPNDKYVSDGQLTATTETEVISTSFSTRNRKHVSYSHHESQKKTAENYSDVSVSSDLNKNSDCDSCVFNSRKVKDRRSPFKGQRNTKFLLPQNGQINQLPSRKLYQCNFAGCIKSYTKRGSLWEHKRTHTGEKPYACTWKGCAWKFQRKYHLARHYQTHTACKPFTCTYCSKVFCRSDNLKKHVKRHAESSLAK